MIKEGVVLLGVQQLKQGRRRVPLMTATNLVVLDETVHLRWEIKRHTEKTLVLLGTFLQWLEGEKNRALGYEGQGPADG